MNEQRLQQIGTEKAAVRTPAAIGAEVRNLTAAAKYLTLFYAVEIGRRLVEAKELVPRGEWLNWLETETEFSQPTASRFMRVFSEYAADQTSIFGAETKYSTLNNLSVSNALRLLAVPAEERESFALEVDAEHLSTRELEAAIRERDEAIRQEKAARARENDIKLDLQIANSRLEDANRQAREDALAAEARIRELERSAEDVELYKSRAECAEEEVAELAKQIKELESRPIDVAVQEPDPEQVERLAAELANKAIAEAAKEEEKRRAEALAPLEARAKEAEEKLRAMEEKAKAERDKLKDKLKAAEEKAKNAAEDAEKRRDEGIAAYEAEAVRVKAEAEQARAEAEALKKKLTMSGSELVAFGLRFKAWQEAYEAMREALKKVPEEAQEKCETAIKAQVSGWSA